MYQVEDKPIETIHLYVVREEETRPATAPIVLSVMLLLAIIAVGTLLPYHTPLEQKTIRIPANFLPPITFTATAPIIPTGVKTYPATKAHGELTIYNGSIFWQEIPAGMIVNAKGIEVVVDASAVIPPGNPPSFGIATISAHTAITGMQGNIPAYEINQVYGASVYIRNLTAFHGGIDMRSIRYATSSDITTASANARAFLTQQIARKHAILAKPCSMSSHVRNTIVGLFWTCQFAIYPQIANARIQSIQVQGKYLFVDVVFVAGQRRIETK